RRLRRGPQLAHRPGVRRGDRGRRRPGAGRPGPRAGRLALPRPRRMNGARVGITAARRAAEQAARVRSLGGVPVLGPALRPDAPAPDDRLAPTLDRVLASPLELAVFLTGVGAELTLALAERLGRAGPLRAALDGAWVVARCSGGGRGGRHTPGASRGSGRPFALSVITRSIRI